MNLFSKVTNKSYPKFCRQHRLVHCWRVEWEGGSAEIDFVLLLVKKILKLFPFERTEVEVDHGRSRDRFGDWDSYLEWFRAESPASERLFHRIKIYRGKKVLGFIQNDSGIVVFTEHDQSHPLGEALGMVMKELAFSKVAVRKTVMPLRMGFQFFQLFR